MLFEFRFRLEGHEQWNKQYIVNLCDGLVQMNVAMMNAEPDLYPHCLGCGGIRYVDAPTCFVKTGGRYKPLPQCQPVNAANILVKLKKGTCLDLSCFLCALKRHRGDPGAHILIDDQYDSYERPVDGKFHMTVMDSLGLHHDAQQLALAGGCDQQAHYNVPDQHAPIGGS